MVERHCWVLRRAGAGGVNNARYFVRVAATDLFAVEASFAVPTQRLDLNFSGAEGRAEAQAASVLDLEGWSGDKATKIVYAGEGTRVADRPLTRVRYRLRADRDQVR